MVRKTNLREQHNWSEIETYFVRDESLPTMKQVAKVFGCHHVSVIRHANKDDWREKRAKYWNSLNSEISDEIRAITIAKSIQRFKHVSTAIDKIIANLPKKQKVQDSTVSDLLRLVSLERDILHDTGIKRDEGEGNMAEIIETQIFRIRKIKGERGDNFRRVVDSGLQRLGLFEDETPSNGDSPARQNVRVRSAPPQEREG